MIIADRVAPVVEKDFVVFLIGMRVNHFWKIWKWFPVFLAMPRMLRELGARKELGLLHYRQHFGFRNFMLVQYWESWDKLQDYARNSEFQHRPAWTDFFSKVGMKGDVGIWHETYLISPGNVEAIYGNMPLYGLGKAFPVEPAVGSMKSAGQRLGREEQEQGAA